MLLDAGADVNTAGESPETTLAPEKNSGKNKATSRKRKAKNVKKQILVESNKKGRTRTLKSLVQRDDDDDNDDDDDVDDE